MYSPTSWRKDNYLLRCLKTIIKDTNNKSKVRSLAKALCSQVLGLGLVR